MSVGTLYATPTAWNANRIRAVAALAGIQIDLIPDFVAGTTQKTPEYVAKFASARAPGFESKTGFCLFESTAIARYIARQAPNSGLLGNSPEDQALVDQWVGFVESELYAHARTSFGIMSGRVAYVKPVDMASREILYGNLEVVEKFLQTKTFLVGHRITFADISLASFITRLFTSLAGPEERAKFPNVLRHHLTIVNKPALKSIYGEVQYADKAQQYVAPAKEKKEKPAPAPKAEKPKAAAAPAAKDEEDDEPLAAEEPKAKNPLDSLPKSSLNLEDWKRAYSNLDTRGPKGSLEWFYEKYDPEGYSLWKVTFKYPTELTLPFMSNNQIGGFFNRLEASRKYLFGSVGVLGEANNSLIEGVFITRGQDIKPVVEVAPDWESYEYTKIDLSNADQKAFFEAALAWDLEVDGKKWAMGKNFK